MTYFNFFLLFIYDFIFQTLINMDKNINKKKEQLQLNEEKITPKQVLNKFIEKNKNFLVMNDGISDFNKLSIKKVKNWLYSVNINPEHSNFPEYVIDKNGNIVVNTNSIIIDKYFDLAKKQLGIVEKKTTNKEWKTIWYIEMNWKKYDISTWYVFLSQKINFLRQKEKENPKKSLNDIVNFNTIYSLKNMCVFSKKIDCNRLKSIFKDPKNVTISNVNNFLNKKERFTENSKLKLWDAQVPNYTFENDESKKEIMNEIYKKWPFKSPLMLAKAIADYMKENLKYDKTELYSYMVFKILQEGGYFGNIKKEWLDKYLSIPNLEMDKEAVSSLSKAINENIIDFSEIPSLQILESIEKVAYFNKPKYKKYFDELKNISKSDDFDKLDDYLEKNKNSKELKQIYFAIYTISNSKKFGFNIDIWKAMEFYNVIMKNNLKEYEKYLNDNLFKDKDVSLLYYMLNAISYDDGWLIPAYAFSYKYKSHSIKNFLKNDKVWVCRDFASVFAKLYNTAVKEWWKDIIKFDKDSVKIQYVWSKEILHAYNVLYYINSNNSIRRVYMDLTSYITEGKNLWSRAPGSENEFFINP